MTTKKEETMRLISAIQDEPLVPAAPVSRRVSMNLVSDFTGELGRVESELSAAKEKLSQYSESLPVKKLDPQKIRASKFANRVTQSFSDNRFNTLKEEIKNAGGNVQPIKVRPIKNGEYEIVYGHRRHRACLDLGIEVIAIIHDGMTDKALFEEMSRENEQRKDLSAYELAAHYNRGIQMKLYKNWSEIGAVLGKAKSLMTRYSALAELPQEIVDIFPSPNEIQPKWAEKLRKVLNDDGKALEDRLKSVMGKNLSAKAIYEILINQQGEKFTRVNFSFGNWCETENKISIELDRSRLSDSHLVSLQKYIASLEKESSPG